MGNINLNIAEKLFINFTPMTTLLIREQNNVKSVNLNYTNGSGQQMTAGQVLYLTGTVGNLGYIEVKVDNDTILNGSGSVSLTVSSYPDTGQANQTISMTFDQSPITLNLIYNSIPVTSNVNVIMPNRTTHNFINTEFINSFTGFDGNTLSEIMSNGNMIHYEYDVNGTNNYTSYTAGTWIPSNNISRLRFVAPDQDDIYDQSNPWFAKDSNGNISTSTSNINVHVNAEPVSPLSYNSYNVGVATQCGNSASQHNVKFNDITGDFVVGKDFTNGAGFPAQTLRIVGFTDESYFIQNSTGNQTPAPGFVPRRLKNTVTNAVISTFPTDVPIANLNQLGVENIGTELICPSDMVNNTARRIRKLTYRIIDSNGNIGAIREARFDNTPQ
jgi:hypothetical protein